MLPRHYLFHLVLYIHTISLSSLAYGAEGGPQQILEPRRITYREKNMDARQAIADLVRQSGIEIDVTEMKNPGTIVIPLKETTFWHGLQSIAEETKCRVAIAHRGKSIALVPLVASSREPESIDGPFRLVIKQIEARLDSTSGQSSYDITMEIAWESQIPVLRIDAVPTITEAEDDGNHHLSVKPISARNPTEGTHFIAKFRVDGLSRKSQKISRLQGSIGVTAAQSMLHFSFNQLAKPQTKKVQNVSLSLQRCIRRGSFWLVDLAIQYPADSPVFESLETYWASRNQITLIAADGTKIRTENEEINGSALRYRFKESPLLKNETLPQWRLEYDAPGTLHEVPIHFQFKDIPLP